MSVVALRTSVIGGNYGQLKLISNHPSTPHHPHIANYH